jgi:class 3 adenylate cyclase
MESIPLLDRKLLAILAADMVGYSKAMEADEAGTIARLTSVRADLIDPAIS